MKTLIIYDNEGYVIHVQSGEYRIPTGIPYIETELKKNQMVVGVDIENKEPIIEELPKQEIDIIQEELSILTYALMMGGLV